MMKAILVFGLILLSLSARANEGDVTLIEAAKQVVVRDFKDPGAAEFRGIWIADGRKSRVVCGEVNGKNSYGGYVGFKKFYVIVDSPTPVIQDGSVRDQMIALACKPPS